MLRLLAIPVPKRCIGASSWWILILTLIFWYAEGDMICSSGRYVPLSVSHINLLWVSCLQVCILLHPGNWFHHVSIPGKIWWLDVVYSNYLRNPKLYFSSIKCNRDIFDISVITEFSHLEGYQSARICPYRGWHTSLFTFDMDGMLQMVMSSPL